jgi:hypothetical protein
MTRSDWFWLAVTVVLLSLAVLYGCWALPHELNQIPPRA